MLKSFTFYQDQHRVPLEELCSRYQADVEMVILNFIFVKANTFIRKLKSLIEIFYLFCKFH